VESLTSSYPLTEWWVVEGTPVVKTWDVCSNPLLVVTPEYYVIHWADGKWTCTCPAYAFSRSKPKTCKHIGRCATGRCV